MKQNRFAAALLVSAFAVACSDSPARPTAVVERLVTESDGGSRASADGDTKSGPVNIDLDLLRVSQGAGGAAAFYATAGGVYTIRPNVSVEFYAQIWTSNPAITNPRMVVDWGKGERDHAGCGACRLGTTYGREGTYRVTVTLDDRVGSTTSRSFTLLVAARPPSSNFGTFSGTISTNDRSAPTTFSGAPFSPPTPSPGTCSVLADGPYYFDTFTIVHEGGPVEIDLIASFAPDLAVYRGSYNEAAPCFNIVALSPRRAVYPAGTYVIVVSTAAKAATGAYTITIK